MPGPFPWPVDEVTLYWKQRAERAEADLAYNRLGIETASADLEEMMRNIATLEMEADVLAALGRNRAIALSYHEIRASIAASMPDDRLPELRRTNYFRRVDRALQSLRKAGLIKCIGMKWREVS